MDYVKGWNYFCPSPGLVVDMHCKVCGEKMDRRDNCNGPTSAAESYDGRKRLHDRFTCSNSEFGWHRQSMNIRIEAESTSSRTLKMMMINEANFIVESKTVTLDKYKDK